ncbi:chemotaxis protein CheW [Sphingomonas japonica]|uniref:Purine-binding chemotaxis protein CheW n=1 Tax=Sphingomonas japonica TaxID=511662 RepID=A0ABX0U5R5_9SPHN|nr:chemotaxis protein CheW [Sphingomonas japonica]NIJ24731.1 purine-binding chemotaxis protein CheW [Sphingomonas japonica]
MNEDLFLIAHIAGHALAFRSSQIESVVDLGQITPVPRAAAHIVGLAALRSRVVTVIDTWSALGLKGGAGVRSRAVIVAQGGHHYALLVDTLDDVASFAALPLESGLSLSPRWHAAARGLIERNAEPILVIDPVALIPTGADAPEKTAAVVH